MIKVALEGIGFIAVHNCSLSSGLLANSLASSAVLIMAESIVKVFPSPISSASMPPPISNGSSFLLQPVITWMYLDFEYYFQGPRLERMTYEMSPSSF